MTPSIQAAFYADRSDRLAAAAATVLVYMGGVISVLLFGSIAVHAVA